MRYPEEAAKFGINNVKECFKGGESRRNILRLTRITTAKQQHHHQQEEEQEEEEEEEQEEQEPQLQKQQKAPLLDNSN